MAITLAAPVLQYIATYGVAAAVAAGLISQEVADRLANSSESVSTGENIVRPGSDEWNEVFGPTATTSAAETYTPSKLDFTGNSRHQGYLDKTDEELRAIASSTHYPSSDIDVAKQILESRGVPIDTAQVRAEDYPKSITVAPNSAEDLTFQQYADQGVYDQPTADENNQLTYKLNPEGALKNELAKAQPATASGTAEPTEAQRIGGNVPAPAIETPDFFKPAKPEDQAITGPATQVTNIGPTAPTVQPSASGAATVTPEQAQGGARPFQPYTGDIQFDSAGNPIQQQDTQAPGANQFVQQLAPAAPVAPVEAYGQAVPTPEQAQGANVAEGPPIGDPGFPLQQGSFDRSGQPVVSAPVAPLEQSVGFESDTVLPLAGQGSFGSILERISQANSLDELDTILASASPDELNDPAIQEAITNASAKLEAGESSDAGEFLAGYVTEDKGGITQFLNDYILGDQTQLPDNAAENFLNDNVLGRANQIDLKDPNDPEEFNGYIPADLYEYGKDRPIKPNAFDEGNEDDKETLAELNDDENKVVDDTQLEIDALNEISNNENPQKAKETIATKLSEAAKKGDNLGKLRWMTAFAMLAGNSAKDSLAFAKELGATEGWYTPDTNSVTGDIKLEGSPQYIDTTGDGKADGTGYSTGTTNAKGQPLFSTGEGLVAGVPVDLTGAQRNLDINEKKSINESLKSIWNTTEGKDYIKKVSSGSDGVREAISLTKAIKSSGDGGVERWLNNLGQGIKNAIGIDSGTTDWSKLTSTQQQAFVENFSLGVGVSNQDLKRYEEAAGLSAWQIAQDPNQFLKFLHNNMRTTWNAGKRYIDANNQYWENKGNESLKVGNDYHKALGELEEYLVSSGQLGSASSPEALATERGKSLWNAHYNPDYTPPNFSAVEVNGENPFGSILDDQTSFNIMQVDDPVVTANAIRYYAGQTGLTDVEQETLTGLKYLYASQIGVDKARLIGEDDIGLVGLSDDEYGTFSTLLDTAVDQDSLVTVAVTAASVSPGVMLTRYAAGKALGAYGTKAYRKGALEGAYGLSKNAKYKEGFVNGFKQWASGRGLQRLGGGSLGGLKASGGKIKMIESAKNFLLDKLGLVSKTAAKGAGVGTVVKKTKEQIFNKQLKKLANQYKRINGKDATGSELSNLKAQAKDAADLIFVRQRGQ